MQNEDLDKIFLNSFLKGYHQSQQVSVQMKQEARLIAEEKQKRLLPIAQFLQKFVDLGVQVHHAEYYDKMFANNNYATNVAFDFYEATTSKSWEPGISIMFDHPANVEIAIPNFDEQGLFVVGISTEHPDAILLKQKFESVTQLCQALAKFIQKSTVAVETNPEEAISQLENKVRFDGSTIKSEEIENQEKEHQSLYQSEENTKPNAMKRLEKYFSKRDGDEDR